MAFVRQDGQNIRVRTNGGLHKIPDPINNNGMCVRRKNMSRDALCTVQDVFRLKCLLD